MIFANLGSEATIDQAKRAVDMLEANALQIHLNVIQELVMPEGDRAFSHALDRIEKIVHHLSCPVIVKEVGFGVSAQAVRQLTSIGVQVIDVGGYGGTNFAHIENKRRENPLSDFNDWGINTVESIVEARSASSTDIIASGGIKTPAHIIKSLLLGGRAVGIAGFFLKYIVENKLEELLDVVDSYHEQLKSMMCALGVTEISQLERVPIILYGKTYHWLQQRGFQPEKLAQRS